MKVAFPTYPGAGRKAHYLDLLAKSLVAAGHKLLPHAFTAPPPKEADFAIFWGFKHQIRVRSQELRMPFLVSEMPYFGSRNAWASLGWNHLARAAIRPPPGDLPRPRPALSPWIASDAGPVVIFGQMPRDYAARHTDIAQWALEMFKEAERVYRRKVWIRPHPHVLRNMGDERPWDTEGYLRAVRAWLTISYSSTAAIKSVCAGIPAIAYHPESMAWDVTGHSIDDRVMPDREEWVHWLSYCQWSEEEFANGVALAHMMKAFDEARADAKG